MSYYVYFIQAGDDGAIKIGITWNVSSRLRALQYANPAELSVLETVRCASKTDAISLEQKLHRRLHEFHIRGEWFEPAPEVRTAIHDPENDDGSYDAHPRTPPRPDWDNPDAPPWADEVDRKNLATLPLVHRRRIVAASARRHGAATSR